LGTTPILNSLFLTFKCLISYQEPEEKEETKPEAKKEEKPTTTAIPNLPKAGFFSNLGSNKITGNLFSPNSKRRWNIISLSL